MTSWTGDDLAALDGRDEIGVASTRTDGSLRPFVTVWFVRIDDELYVRSAYGPENGWFRRALRVGRGTRPRRRHRTRREVRGARPRAPGGAGRRVSRQVRPLREGHGPDGRLAGRRPLDAAARPALTPR